MSGTGWLSSYARQGSFTFPTWVAEFTVLFDISNESGAFDSLFLYPTLGREPGLDRSGTLRCAFRSPISRERTCVTGGLLLRRWGLGLGV